MTLVLRWIINALAILLIAWMVPGFEIAGLYAALIGALILGLVNALIRPILFVLTLPVTIVTLGLFAFVINALMIWFVSTVVKGFDVSGFVPALLAAILLWAVSLATNKLIKQAKKS